MGGITALKKIQMGKETTAGTATTATVVFRGKGDIKDAREFGISAEDIGQLLPKDRQYEKSRLGLVTMPDQEATFEFMTYILAAAIEKVLAVRGPVREILAAKAMANIREHFSTASMCAKTLAVYDEVLAGPPPIP